MKKLLTLIFAVTVFANAQSQNRVGIGTATPADKLHVIGSIRIPFQQSIKSENNVGVPVEMIQMNLVGAVPKIVIGDYPDGSTTQWGIRLLTSTNPTGAVDIWNGTSSVAWFGQNGNVGIGTAAPTRKLYIVDGGLSGGTPNVNSSLVVEKNTASYINLMTPNGSENGILFGTASNSENGAIIFNNPANLNGLDFRTGGNITKMVISSGGNVGIGTSAPSSTLDVAGTTTTTGFIMPTGAVNGYILSTNGVGVAAWIDPTLLSMTETDPQVSSATNNMIPKWNATTLTDGIIYDDGTNIGIGITSPSHKLHVSGGIRMTNGINGNNGTDTQPTYSFNSDTDVGMFRASTNQLAFSTNGTERMRINASGNVGIATSSPSTTLDVNGTVTVSGANTNEVNRAQTGAANLVPIAYGVINASGVIQSGSGNFTASWAGTGAYQITITGETYDRETYPTFATLHCSCIGSEYGGQVSITETAGTLIVWTNNEAGTEMNMQFSFMVYKP